MMGIFTTLVSGGLTRVFGVKTTIRGYVLNLIIFLALFSCQLILSAGAVIYNGNGNDEGTPPVDSTIYAEGDDVFVKWSDPLTKS